MNQLTPEALDALLAEHQKHDCPSCDGYCEECGHVVNCWPDSPWPCTIYLLASEVQDAREAAKPKKCPGCAVDVPAALDAHLPECSVRQWHEAMDDVEFDDE